MKATSLDMRRRMGDVLAALDKNETVSLMHRGKLKGMIVPANSGAEAEMPVREHPAFGMWKGRSDAAAPDKFARELRKGRFGDI